MAAGDVSGSQERRERQREGGRGDRERERDESAATTVCRRLLLAFTCLPWVKVFTSGGEGACEASQCLRTHLLLLVSSVRLDLGLQEDGSVRLSAHLQRHGFQALDVEGRDVSRPSVVPLALGVQSVQLDPAMRVRRHGACRCTGWRDWRQRRVTRGLVAWEGKREEEEGSVRVLGCRRRGWHCFSQQHRGVEDTRRGVQRRKREQRQRDCNDKTGAAAGAAVWVIDRSSPDQLVSGASDSRRRRQTHATGTAGQEGEERRRRVCCGSWIR